MRLCTFRPHAGGPPARDLQRLENRVGLGPAKGKDFATSLGPVLVTADEWVGSRAEMVARVNGEERSRGNLADLYHPWPALVAQAARNTVLRPGDVVELEVEGLGVLRNRIGPASPAADAG